MTTGERPPIGPPAFAPHGAVDPAETPGTSARVIYIDAAGPFNREMVDRIRAVYTPAFRELAQQGPFGHISIFRGSMLATPEAFTAFAALLAEWKAMGILPTASAYVVGPEVEGRVFVEAHYRRAWEGNPFDIFDRRDDAEAWLARMLDRPA